MANLSALLVGLGAALTVAGAVLGATASAQEVPAVSTPLLSIADWAEEAPPPRHAQKLRVEREAEDTFPAGNLYYDTGSGLMVGAQGRLGGPGGPRALLGLKLRF